MWIRLSFAATAAALACAVVALVEHNRNSIHGAYFDRSVGADASASTGLWIALTIALLAVSLVFCVVHFRTKR